MTNPEVNIRNLIDIANEAMRNSDVPVRLDEFCIQELNVGAESQFPGFRLSAFMNARGGSAGALNTADIAILMMGTYAANRVAGQVARVGPNQTPLLWVSRGYERVGFVHEIGHIFGARHNM